MIGCFFQSFYFWLLNFLFGGFTFSFSKFSFLGDDSSIRFRDSRIYFFEKNQILYRPIKAVLIAWYFSLCIVTILPNDISATFYRQCIEKHKEISSTTLPPPNDSLSFTPVAALSDILQQSDDYQNPGPDVYPAGYGDYPAGVESANRYRREMVTPAPTAPPTPEPPPNCIEPASLVLNIGVIPTLYRIVYWSTQLLTWLLIPFLSSYVQSGEFTILSKAKTAVIDNAIYYGTYLIIFVILLIYAAASTSFNLSFSNLKVVGISAANTWGLFLLGKHYRLVNVRLLVINHFSFSFITWIRPG